MKTFEGHTTSSSEAESRVVIFFMYLLRAVSSTLIISLFFYIPMRVLGSYEARFLEFIAGNFILLFCFLAFLFIIQLLAYLYRVKRGMRRRSMVSVIIGYALPLIGIAVVLYVVYAIGAI